MGIQERRSWLFPGLTGLTTLFLLVGCGSAATATPAPTATPLPSPTATLTVTPTSGRGPGNILPVNPSGTPGGGGGPASGTSILPRPSGTPLFAPPTGTTLIGRPPTPTAFSTGAVPANSDGSCPDTHPIKATLLGKVYHLKDDASYARARAEECFATEADAQAAGYRRVPR